MKKMILSATALMLSGSALAASVPTVTDPSLATTAYAGNYLWTVNPLLVQNAWLGPMSYAEAAAYTGDKPAELTSEQIAQKNVWLASNMAAGDMLMDKPVELTSEQIAEKTVWLASNAATGEAWAAKPADATMTGQGGPFESAEAERTSWPACDPGPGDDRCIQLYERGVRGAYAQWSAGREQMAMGGPEEPIGKDGMAMASVDMSASTTGKPIASGPTTEPTGVRVAGKSSDMDTADMSGSTETPVAQSDDFAALNYHEDGVMSAEEMHTAPVYAQHSTDSIYDGVGGPLEEVREYPLCSSRSDDRCQQGS